MVILINLIVQAYERGTPKTQNLYKKLCIYSYMFKLQSPSKYSSFDAIQLSRHFFHCSKQFLNSLILMSFHASAIFFCLFVSPLLHWQNVFLWGLFHWGNRKVALGNIGWIGRVGHRGHAVFSKKTAEHSVWCGQVCLQIIHHEMGRYVWKSLQKNSLKLNTASLTTMPAGILIQMGF